MLLCVKVGVARHWAKKRILGTSGYTCWSATYGAMRKTNKNYKNLGPPPSPVSRHEPQQIADAIKYSREIS